MTAPEVPNSLPSPGKMRFANGTSIGHYEVLEPLGQGGMGEVYLARDTRLGRRVALKFLSQVNAKQSARFFVEARATAQLTHENIVSLYDIAEHEGLPYMVLEYVQGKTLSMWLRERRQGDRFELVPPIQAAEIMAPVVRALQCAHEAGIVHRDLKPANIMLAKSGTVKVLDFGVAKLVATAQPAPEGDGHTESPEAWAKQASTMADLTETGAMVGTRIYMAPEQWWGENVDGRTDIWAVGIMLFQMVTGEHPLGPLTPAALVRIAERYVPMPRTSDIMPALGELGSIIDRCLLKEIEDRWASARELGEALDRFLRVSSSIRPSAPDTNSLFFDKREPSVRLSLGRISIDDGPLDMANTVQEGRGPAAEKSVQPVPEETKSPSTVGEVLPKKPASHVFPWAIAVMGLGLCALALTWRNETPSSNSQTGNSAAGTNAGTSAGSRECAANIDCVGKAEGNAVVCRQDTGTCISLEAPRCRILADKQEIENDATIWIGAMYPITNKGSTYGKQAARAIELAHRDFHEIGGIPAVTLGGKPRPLGVVLCDDTEDHERIAKHLVEVVRVPVILGFARSKEVMDLATTLFLPKGVMALASNTGSTLADIPHLPGEPRLVLRVTSSADMINRPNAKFIEQILEPQLKARGIVGRNEAMRIALVRVDNASGVSHTDKLISFLHWNGKSAIDNGDLVRQFVVPDAIGKTDRSGEMRRVGDAVAAFAPHVIVEAGADAEPFLFIERQWLSSTPFRPFYVTSVALTQPSFGPFLKEFSGAERRLFNLNTKTTAAAKKFAMHYNEIFTDEKIDPFEATPAPYDAFYTAAYAMIALGDEPVTGKSLSRSIRRLVPPGESIEVGPANIYKATKSLRDGKNIDLVGAQTSLDFDPETGDPTIESAIICMDSTTHTGMDSGLVYDVRGAKWSGTMTCP